VDSDYIVQVARGKYIDARNEGNLLRFINHRCKNPNAVFISVRREGIESVFVKAIKRIEGGQFISIDYGRTYKITDCKCLDCQVK
jgi:SET domain-containing protein